MERARVAAFAVSVLAGLTTLATVAAVLSPVPAWAAGEACVADVAKVIRTPPSASMAGPLPAELVARLDRAAQEAFRQSLAPGAIVGVSTPQGTWTTAYGKADPAKGVPMAVDMHVRVGSITKTFIGTILMQLSEAGKLQLDDPIDKYVPGIPNGASISLRRLADMTSGVASYTRNKAFTDLLFARPESVFTPPQLLAYGISESPLFAPGERFDYSNSNTVLLGLVIEKVTGRPIGDVLKAAILGPLKLANTVWPGDSPDLPSPYAQGFTLQGDTAKPDAPANATHWNPSWGWTAGELISDVRDLLVYGRALVTGQGLLSPEAQTARLTSFPGKAGYGIALGCIDGWVGHTGELPGYNTTVFHDTTSDSTVIVLANSDIASGDCPESPTLSDDPRDLICSSPATRIFVGVSTALGHAFQPLPQR